VFNFKGCDLVDLVHVLDKCECQILNPKSVQKSGLHHLLPREFIGLNFVKSVFFWRENKER